jgi:23S rRNA pseudouridine1911/1915/1917 synthase
LPSKEIITITVHETTTRIDQFLAQSVPSLSRSRLQKLIREGEIQLNAKKIRSSTAVQPGDVITIHLPVAVENDALQPEKISLDVIHEDAEFVVINKPAGMVIHPAPGQEHGTLVHALLDRYPALVTLNQDNPGRPGIVHRLDQDTSGLVVVARTTFALDQLQQQFKNRTVQKTYLALVFGQPPAPSGVIDVPLGRDPKYRQRMSPKTDGKSARTHYRLRQYFGLYSLLEVDLETGRTHQIRVHLAWLKVPVVGDTVYGRKKNSLGLSRQFLHAWRLGFNHPRTEQPLQFEAPLDEGLQQILMALGSSNF